jgi:hypothetical protein
MYVIQSIHWHHSHNVCYQTIILTTTTLKLLSNSLFQQTRITALLTGTDAKHTREVSISTFSFYGPLNTEIEHTLSSCGQPPATQGF